MIKKLKWDEPTELLQQDQDLNSQLVEVFNGIFVEFNITQRLFIWYIANFSRWPSYTCRMVTQTFVNSGTSLKLYDSYIVQIIHIKRDKNGPHPTPFFPLIFWWIFLMYFWVIYFFYIIIINNILLSLLHVKIHSKNWKKFCLDWYYLLNFKSIKGKWR